MTDARQAPARQGRAAAWTLLAAALLFLAWIGQLNLLDHDLFHEMALAREVWARGALPLQDLFAYTPTLSPLVHHEWGAGMVFYAAACALGAPGLMALKLLLSAAIAVLIARCARRRLRGWACFCVLTPAAVAMGFIGFATVRAQIFTLACTALLSLLLELEREGARWWLAAWLVACAVWVNLHAGFVVGGALLAAHWAEGALHGRGAQPRLLLAGLAMAALVFATPYGADYPRYLAHALLMPRPAIPEWQPLWRSVMRLWLLPPFLLSLAVLAYALAASGWRRLPGLLATLLCACAALRHTRHLSLYAVVWLCHAPGWLEDTPLGAWLERLWREKERLVGWAAVALSAACLASLIQDRAWRVYIPCNAEDAGPGSMIVYPVGAAQYLEDAGFRGNVMTPFRAGAYVSWRLYPAVKVSLDGRYELAYRPGIFEEVNGFYDGAPGWRETLARYPTDLVLTRAWYPVVKLLETQTAWRRVYQDGVFELFARPGLMLPGKDRRGERLACAFPGPCRPRPCASPRERGL